MSWDDHCEALYKKGNFESVVLVGASGGVWGSYGLLKREEFTLGDIEAIAKRFTTDKDNMSSIKVGSESFMILSKDPEKSTIFTRNSGKSLIVTKCKNCIILGIVGKDHNPRSANVEQSKYQDYLVSMNQ